MKEVVFSTRARNRIEALLEHLETEWSFKVKQNFVNKLDQSLSRISQYPKSCPISTQKKGVYKCVVSKQTTLYYRVKTKEIEVIALFDNRQDPNDLNL